MSTVAADREVAIQELAEQLRPVLDASPDGVYLWLDESHKVCNDRLARMHGMTVKEWCEAEPFLESFVAEEDRANYAWNYHNRVAGLQFPCTFRYRAQHKDGTTFGAETDMIPLTCRGHAVAYHFVRRVGE
jgi:PAS domain-containing protein